MNPFLPLLDFLAADPPHTAQSWQDWQITPIPGGANNLLYRVTDQSGSYAVKFTIRDARNRAGREYATLQALQAAGLQIAPQAIHLETERYKQPVVLQSWLEGEALSQPPQTAQAWTAMLRHYYQIHSLTQTEKSPPLAEAVLNVASGETGKSLVYHDLAKIPQEARPDSLQALITRFEQWQPPTWSPPPRTLCRADANWRNFIRRETGWASVDWEYSGWGDPAFEMAELMTHPAYEGVDPTIWQPLVEEYAAMRGDPTAILRIECYHIIMLVWWAVRYTRTLYEVPRGLDARLVAYPADWLARTEQKYQATLEKIKYYTRF